MPLATTILAVLAFPDEQLRTHVDQKVGISIQHPRSWALRKDRMNTFLTWKSRAGREVRAQWVATAYRDTAELWQRLQVDVANSRGDRIVRQWDEELLGVPLLLTRASRDDKGVPKSVFSGLIYSRTANKLNFRVYSAPEDAAEAEKTWREVLLTLRTTSGEVPLAEAPGTKLAPEKAKVPEVTSFTWSPVAGQVAKPVRAPKRSKVEEVGFYVYTPEGWTADGTHLIADGLRGRLVLDAKKSSPESGRRTWVAAAGAQLAKLTEVTARREKEVGRNRAGFMVWEVVREAKLDGAQVVAAVWGGQFDENVWLLTYEGTAEEFRGDRRLIDGLVQSLSVESAG